MNDDISKFINKVGDVEQKLDNSIFEGKDTVDIEERDFELLSVPSHVNIGVSDASHDYAMSRQILYSLIDRSGKNLEMLTQLALINQDANTFKVANDVTTTMMQLLKALNSNHKLHREVHGMPDLVVAESMNSSNVKFKGSLLTLKQSLESGEIETTKNDDYSL